MKPHIHLFLFPFILISSAFCQNSIIIKGHLKDATNQQPITYGDIRVNGTSLGATSLEDGSFQLPIQKPSTLIKLSIRAIGYEAQELEIDPNRIPLSLQIQMELASYELDPVLIIPPVEILKKALAQQQLYDSAPFQLDAHYRGKLLNETAQQAYFDLEALIHQNYIYGYDTYAGGRMPYIVQAKSYLPDSLLQDFWWEGFQNLAWTGHYVLYFPCDPDGRAFKKHVSLELERHTYYDGKPVFVLKYAISRQLGKKSHYHLGFPGAKIQHFEGRIYVQQDNFAIIRREGTARFGKDQEDENLEMIPDMLHKKYLKKENRFMLTKRSFVRNYYPYEGKYYLRYERVEHAGYYVYRGYAVSGFSETVVTRVKTGYSDRESMVDPNSYAPWEYRAIKLVPELVR